MAVNKGIYNGIWKLSGAGIQPDFTCRWGVSSWDNRDVRVSMDNFNDSLGGSLGLEFKYYWKMELRRTNESNGIDVIASRTGYISHFSPSSRTFTNVVPYMNRRLDVKVRFYLDSAMTRLVDTKYTPLWTHYWG